MKLVFIYGLPAVGKLTVAQELANITGYTIFHNHLVVDLLQTLFEFGSPQFVALREEFWLSIFDQACRSAMRGMIFTFAPEATVRPNFIDRVISTVSAAASEVDFIELTSPVDELRRRMPGNSRKQFKKLTSVELFDELHQQGAFESTHMPTPRLSVDTSINQPARAALLIARALELLPPQP